MAKLRFAQFSGEIPKLIARLLPDTAAQHAENVRLDDGGLTPVRKSRLEHTFAGSDDIKTIYKFGSTWLSWTSVVHAVPGPVAADRLYYTGDGLPKMRIGSAVLDLKVPYPTTALTAAASGTGTGDVITRLYCYTWVTQYGEESEPNPISNEVLWQSGKTVTLSGFTVAPAGRGITKQRIYRSQSASQAGTDLFLIAERSDVTTNFVDNIAPTAFGEILPSREWNQPPDDLQGLIALPNGMMAGFTGKQICFCEPYRPHAWPEKYRLTTSYPIVALAAFDTTIVAATQGYPYAASGNSPESMIEQKMELNLPCINGRGMIDLGYSAAYPSNDGLVIVSSQGASVATNALFTRADWQKISPATIVAGQFAGRYMASYEYTEIDGTIFSGTFILDLTGSQPFVIRAPFKAKAFHYDLATGQLYYLIGNAIYEYDAIGEVNEIMTWKSKRVVLEAPAAFGAILIEASPETLEQKAALAAQQAAALAENATLFALDSMGSEIDASAIAEIVHGGDNLNVIQQEEFTSVKVYADGDLLATVSAIDDARRLPAVRKARIWEIQVNGSAPLEQITLATSVRELNEI